MLTVTVSSKHQITLPVELVRALGLKKGNALIQQRVDEFPNTYGIV